MAHLSDHQIEALAHSFENELKEITDDHGQRWSFEYMYPGFFVYGRFDRMVFFTPDFNALGEVDIQVQDSNGNEIEEGDSIPYGDPSQLDAAALFAIVKPILERVR